MHGAVHAEQSGIALAGIHEYFVEVYIVATHPAAIEPQNVDIAIVAGQLGELILGEGLIVLPPFGMALYLIVVQSVGCGIIGIPIPLAVPVGLREIASYPEIFLAESVEHMAKHIAARIVAIGCLGYCEIGVFRVVHTETIVMLAGKHQILHSGIVHNLCPLIGIEFHGIEHIFKVEIPFLVFVVGNIGATAYPVHIFRADAPTLHYAGHAIQAPVKEHSKLKVAPLVEFFEHLLIGGPLIACAAAMHLCAHSLSQNIGIQSHY